MVVSNSLGKTSVISEKLIETKIDGINLPSTQISGKCLDMNNISLIIGKQIIQASIKRTFNNKKQKFEYESELKVNEIPNLSTGCLFKDDKQ